MARVGVPHEGSLPTIGESARRIWIGEGSVVSGRHASRTIEGIRGPERCRERWIAELYLVGTVRPRIAVRNGEVVEARQGSDAVQRLRTVDELDRLFGLPA